MGQVVEHLHLVRLDGLLQQDSTSHHSTSHHSTSHHTSQLTLTLSLVFWLPFSAVCSDRGREQTGAHSQEQ